MSVEHIITSNCKFETTCNIHKQNETFRNYNRLLIPDSHLRGSLEFLYSKF